MICDYDLRPLRSALDLGIYGPRQVNASIILMLLLFKVTQEKRKLTFHFFFISNRSVFIENVVVVNKLKLVIKQ